MRFLSLFAGIGGFDLGLERAGHECAGQIEIDAFCRRVLGARFASVEQQADVRVAAFHDGGSRIDLLTGGFPCQDLSVAGKRAGLAGERSGLFWEIVRIAKIVRPAWGLFENVPGLLSSRRGADMWTVLAGLRECWPVVGFRVLDSRYFGVPQRRRRVFFVCGPTEAGVRAVLFEPEGGEGDSQESGEAGAGIAEAITVGALDAGGGGGSKAYGGAWQGYTAQGAQQGHLIAASLTSGVGAASNDPGRRREDDVNLVAACLDGSPYADREAEESRLVVDTLIASTLNSGGNDGGFRTEPGEHLVAHSLSAEGADASEDGTGRGTPLTWNWQSGGDVRHSLGLPNLQASQVPATGVRRLTPLECERLQGFPDGWTCLCQPMSAYQENADEAAMRCKCPDSPRYRALGNAVTVNVIEWLGRRLPA